MNESFMNMNPGNSMRATSICVTPCMVRPQSVDFSSGTLSTVYRLWRNASMARVKQASKRKRVTKTVPVLGAAGLTFSLVGGASAAVAPAQDVPQTPNIAPTHEFLLNEEEISDVSLATFYVFDKENTGSLRGMVKEARGCGCRGCRGCGGRGCGCAGCAGCCLSWGACRLC